MKIVRKMHHTVFIVFTMMTISCENEDVCIKESADEIFISVGDKTGEDAFWALYNAHIDAVKTGKRVRYSGEKINLTIPEDAKSIPLTSNTEFGNTTITVENKCIDGFFLFTLIGEALPININQSLLGGRNFTSVPELSKGCVLLLLWDDNPWVKTRKGFNYGASRQDVLLLKDGILHNSPVMPWDNPVTTKPLVTYVQTDDKEKKIQNLIFNRTSSSTMKTMLVRVEYQNNVLLDNITVNTPENDVMYGDYVIRIYNSSNVTVKDVTINGTYSQKDKYGYGMNMLNDYNSHFVRLKAKGKWGVFGTNNMNKVLIEDSNINRFDIHCYGKDITMKNVIFENLYNQYSSVYGTIRYENCYFKSHTPYLTETSYNCYVPFTIEMKDCVWEVPSNGIPGALCIMGNLAAEHNERPELKTRACPNVFIDGLKVIAPSRFNVVYVFWIDDDVDVSRPVENISNVVINNLEFSDSACFNLWNKEISTVNTINYIANKK